GVGREDSCKPSRSLASGGGDTWLVQSRCPPLPSTSASTIASALPPSGLVGDCALVYRMVARIITTHAANGLRELLILALASKEVSDDAQLQTRPSQRPSCTSRRHARKDSTVHTRFLLIMLSRCPGGS